MAIADDNLVLEYSQLSFGRKKTDRTKKEYLNNLNQFREFIYEHRNKSLSELNALDLSLFLEHKGISCSDRTLARKFYAIKFFLKYLRKKNLFDSNELEYLIEFSPKFEEDSEAHRALSTEDIKKIFSKITLPYHEFLFKFGLEFGIRISEYTTITLEDLDLNRGFLRIRGKGKKIRYIPIPKRFYSDIENFLEDRKLDGVKHEFLFYTLRGKSVPRTLQKYFQKIAVAAGVKFTSHDLRVTFATRYWEAGMDIYTISIMLGHKNIETTLLYIKPKIQEHFKRFQDIAEENPPVLI